ncbi:MAG: autotransporter outer membrane beta-barrel domain-containing protein, partial [Megamonas funiformis]|uniref:autotransporter outer membrane beta-barrel domain-containing protein n=1 Tax=Megamonas funiformis TaxID=437897 RepID=UPI003993A2FF
MVVGSDFYKNGKSTVGVALSYADGDISGNNIASRTQNDAEYYGVSLYGKIDNGDSAVLGDISFMHSSNDITQYNSGTEITASPDADAFSIGVRAEKAIKSGANGKFVPYIGARYMHLGTADYTNSLGINYTVDEQNLFILPVGVKYSTEIRNNDWTIRPVAEVGYVWTMGDRDVDQTVSLNGAFDSFGFETVDNGSFIG